MSTHKKVMKSESGTKYLQQLPVSQSVGPDVYSSLDSTGLRCTRGSIRKTPRTFSSPENISKVHWTVGSDN